MENKPIARKLRLLAQLMELHEGNPFKVKSIANAAFKVDKLPYTLAGKPVDDIEKIDGIGKSTAAKIAELLANGNIAELDELLAKTPEGVIQMMGIKGIGPKKVAVIWKDLCIDNIGELYYACNENRLIEAKGFGYKTQEEIFKAIEFAMASSGKFLYAQVEPEAKWALDQLKEMFPGALIEFSGEFRRCLEIISKLTIVVASRDQDIALQALAGSGFMNDVRTNKNCVTGKLENGLQVEITCVEKRDFFLELFLQTGTKEHVDAVLERAVETPDQPASEALIYTKAGLDFIPPELREGTDFIEKADHHNLPALITYYDLKGALHNHSNWSDGINTIEEMALYCRDELKLEYLGMCDHSQSAFYARGLTIERVLQQHEEIDSLNRKLEGFKIFKGIESDILFDGSLDYPDEILKRFDFIVASVHSILKMNQEKATSRLIKAIENPYTTILGHPTGRLLLSRNGYAVDFKKVIDACAANNVIIEINANPFRLDMDWRWHQYAVEQGVMLSINPDAHRREGLADMRYGVLAARKGGLTKESCLNALSLQEITNVFNKKRETVNTITQN